jgi:hypothetical protein
MRVTVEKVPLGKPKRFEYTLDKTTETEDAAANDADDIMVLWVETDQRKENIRVS